MAHYLDISLMSRLFHLVLYFLSRILFISLVVLFFSNFSVVDGG